MQDVEQIIAEGEAAHASGDLANARGILESALAQNDQKWMGWRAVGKVYLDQGEHSLALDAFKKATVIRPDDAENQYGLGLAFQRLKDHGHAISAFEAAIKYDLHHQGARKAIVESSLARSEDMRGIGNLLAVEEYLEKAHKYDPANMDTTKKLLTYYDETGQAGKVAAIMKELKAMGLEAPEHHATGSFHTEHSAADTIGVTPADIPALKAAIEANGEDWKAWRSLGRAQLANNDAKAAEEAFKRATVIRADDADSQSGLGLALQALGDHGHAIPHFELALKQDIEHAEARSALKVSLLDRCRVMRDIGNLLAIEQYLERAHKLDEGDNSVTGMLLAYYNETGQATKAAQLTGGSTFVSVTSAAAPPPSAQDEAAAGPKQHEDMVKDYVPESDEEDEATGAAIRTGGIVETDTGLRMVPCPAC